MKNSLKILALGVAIAASATMAKADTITGNITISGANDSWNTAGVTFDPTAPATSPNATAYNATGTFANFASSAALASSGSPADVFNFNYDQKSGLLFAVGSSLTHYLGLTIQSITVFTDTTDYLNIGGTGLLSEVGGTDTATEATWTFTSTDDGTSSFTINSSVPAPTPEPSSLALLGTSLLGAAGIARRRFVRS